MLDIDVPRTAERRRSGRLVEAPIERRRMSAWVVDFETATAFDRLELDIDGADFSKRVHFETSLDGAQWTRVGGDAWVFDWPWRGRRIHDTAIEQPAPLTARYVRLTVDDVHSQAGCRPQRHGGADDAPGRAPLDARGGAGAARHAGRPAVALSHRRAGRGAGRCPFGDCHRRRRVLARRPRLRGGPARRGGAGVRARDYLSRPPRRRLSRRRASRRRPGAAHRGAADRRDSGRRQPAAGPRPGDPLRDGAAVVLPATAGTR